MDILVHPMHFDVSSVRPSIWHLWTRIWHH